jgi:hypothetical protein
MWCLVRSIAHLNVWVRRKDEIKVSTETRENSENIVHHLTWSHPDSNHILRAQKSAHNCPSYGADIINSFKDTIFFIQGPLLHGHVKS